MPTNQFRHQGTDLPRNKPTSPRRDHGDRQRAHASGSLPGNRARFPIRNRWGRESRCSGKKISHVQSAKRITLISADGRFVEPARKDQPTARLAILQPAQEIGNCAVSMMQVRNERLRSRGVQNSTGQVWVDIKRERWIDRGEVIGFPTLGAGRDELAGTPTAEKRHRQLHSGARSPAFPRLAYRNFRTGTELTIGIIRVDLTIRWPRSVC